MPQVYPDRATLPRRKASALKPSIQMDSPQFTDSKVKTFTRPVDNVRPKEPEFMSFKEASRNSNENQQSSKAGNLDRFMKPNPSQQDSIDVQRPSLQISQSFGSKQFDAQNMKTLVSDVRPLQQNNQIFFEEEPNNDRPAGRFRSEYIAAKPSNGETTEQQATQQARFAVQGSKHSSVNDYPSDNTRRHEGCPTVTNDNYKSQHADQFKVLSKYMQVNEASEPQNRQLWAGRSWKEDEAKLASGELWSKLPPIGQKMEDPLSKALPSNKVLVAMSGEGSDRTKDFHILKRFVHDTPQGKTTPHTRSNQREAETHLRSPLSVQTTGPRFSAGCEHT
jgi:hypothetical protein